MKGKVIVIKRRGPVSGRPRCGRAYKRTGSRQFNSGSLPWRASERAMPQKWGAVVGGGVLGGCERVGVSTEELEEGVWRGFSTAMS